MMKRLSIYLFLLFTLAGSVQAFAQKKPYLTDPEEIEALAKSTLDEMMSADGSLMKFAQKEEIKGTYTYDIAIWNKGQVSTVRPVSRDGEIESQNRIKDVLMGVKFPVKLPKNQNYKFQYEFKF